MTSSDRQRPRAYAPVPDELPVVDPIDAGVDAGVPPLDGDDLAGAPSIPADGSGREAFSHPPARRRTQPPASVTAEDFEGDDYAESTSYTVRSRQPLSGAGYRRSRHQAARLRRDLRYGQYLEVPKGQKDIFTPQARRRSATIALVIALALVAAIIVLGVLLWPR